jgi:hypothetical protein
MRYSVSQWSRRTHLARTIGELPSGSRITDYISFGVIAGTFPLASVRSVLDATAKSSVRQRDLPAHVVVYYVIALALFMQSSYGEVLRWPIFRFFAQSPFNRVAMNVPEFFREVRVAANVAVIAAAEMSAVHALPGGRLNLLGG